MDVTSSGFKSFGVIVMNCGVVLVMFVFELLGNEFILH